MYGCHILFDFPPAIQAVGVTPGIRRLPYVVLFSEFERAALEFES